MFSSFPSHIRQFVRDRSGAQAIEYGLMLSLLVIAIIAAVSSLGSSTGDAFQKVKDEWAAAEKG